MARPRPPEDFDPITVRMPMSTAKVIRALAAESRSANGQAMSLSEYCVAVLTEAAEAELKLTARVRYDMSATLPSLKVAAEKSPDEGKQKKRA